MYGLCRDTVTILRDGQTLCLTGCCLQEKQIQKKDFHGTWGEREFLLIVPGDRPIYPGDKVCFDGGNMTVRTVIPYFLDGRICHREGRGS
jgi:hypothetical protein